MAENIIEQLKQSGLLGRSGSNFPVWKKWQGVKDTLGDKKYVVCNGSEGEPMVSKDAFVLNNHLKEVIEGVRLAMQTISAVSGYIYLNSEFYQKYKTKIIEIAGNWPIEIFLKPAGYLAGEETSLLNVIEGKRAEPRLKPPYPTEKGLWNCPTIINNVETFYWVSKIAKNEYANKRFFDIEGDVKNKGVFELPENFTIEQILKETKNYPDFPFFLQVGGGAVGEILLSNELTRPINGLASIIVFNKEKENPFELMKNWIQFLMMQNCDQCVPCREGLYRINEILQEQDQEKKISPNSQNNLNEIFAVLEKTSLCPFGRTAYLPFKTAIEKLL